MDSTRPRPGGCSSARSDCRVAWTSRGAISSRCSRVAGGLTRCRPRALARRRARRVARLRGARQRHAAAHDGPARHAPARVLSRARHAARRRRRGGQAAVSHRRGVAPRVYGIAPRHAPRPTRDAISTSPRSPRATAGWAATRIWRRWSSGCATSGRGRTLLLDGGDTLQGSATALWSRGEDMVRARTSSAWRSSRRTGSSPTASSASRSCSATRARAASSRGDFVCPQRARAELGRPRLSPVHDARGRRRAGRRHRPGVSRTRRSPIRARFVPDLTFGIREDERPGAGERAARRQEGGRRRAALSHNGIAVDLKLAGRVRGLDVDPGRAHPRRAAAPIRVGRTLVVNSGSHGKFLSRAGPGRPRRRASRAYRYGSCPVLAGHVPADPDMARLIDEIRAPLRGEARRAAGGVGDPALPARQLQRHASTSSSSTRCSSAPTPRWRSRRASGGASPSCPARRSRSRTSTRTPPDLPEHVDAGADGRRDPPDDGGRGRQPLPPRPVLPPGRRHGAAGRADVRRSIRARRMGRRIRDIRVGGRPLDPGAALQDSGWASLGPEAPGRPRGTSWPIICAVSGACVSILGRACGSSDLGACVRERACRQRVGRGRGGPPRGTRCAAIARLHSMGPRDRCARLR